MCYYKLKDFKKAQVILEEVVIRFPDYLKAQKNLALVYLAMGKKDNAINLYKTILQHSSDMDVKGKLDSLTAK